MRWWALALALVLPLFAGCVRWTGAVPHPPPPAYPAVVLAARDDLAGRLGVAPADIAIVEYTPMEWPDACVGIYEPGMVCAQVITSGYRTVLSYGDSTCVYHNTRPHPLFCPLLLAPP
jgi:hypothetical protein